MIAGESQTEVWSFSLRIGIRIGAGRFESAGPLTERKSSWNSCEKGNLRF